MYLPQSLSLLLCLCLFCTIELKAQPPDVVEIGVLGNEANLRVDINEPLDALVNAPDPRYTTFWIYGDGHYVKDLTPIFNNSLTSPIQTHRYAASTNYDVNAYLLDRYSNHAPPPLFANPNNVDINNLTVPPTLQVPIIDMGRSIEIDTNHDARPNHKTVYVLSYLNGRGQKDDEDPSQGQGSSETGRILFFYNGIKNGNAVDPSPASFSPFKTHLPHYSDQARLSPSESTLAFDGVHGTQFQDDYADVISYQYIYGEVPKDQSNGQEVFPEGRIFHALDNDPNLVIGETFRFLAIITGQKDNLNELIGRPDWGEVSPLAPNGKIGAEFIEDYYILEQPVVAAHDPNRLYITDMCRCSDGNYEIEYTLDFCNDGDGRAIEAIIRIIDETKNFYCYERVSHFPAGNISTTFPSSPGGVPHQWTEHITNIFLAPAAEEFEPDDEKSCGKLVFTLVTPEENIANLIFGKSLPLKACVSFMVGGEEVCAEHELDRCEELLDSAQNPCEPDCDCKDVAASSGVGSSSNDENGSNTGKDFEIVRPATWPIWVFGILGLSLLIFGFYAGKRNKE
ncbi:MAG: hypothetical protein AAFP19_18070 [Bacteroidota bacterium]